ncbi:hypothetical protein EV426DRAFT_577945 [Tirmania nivea]|nr:hypothetical protein EV426DRAFT_577945 [Tirmania nivea]
MLRPNGGRQALRKTVASLRLDSEAPRPSSGPSSSSSSLPLPERNLNTPAGLSMPVIYPEPPQQMEYNIEDTDDLDTEFGGDGEDGRRGNSFQLYGHSNDSAELYSINSTSGFRETTEELDGLAVENMVLREDFGRLSSFLQRNHPEIYTQFTASSPYNEPAPLPPPPPPPRNSTSGLIPPSLGPTPNPSPSTTSLQSLLKRKEHDLTTLHSLRAQQDSELNSLRKQVKGLQDFIIQSRNKTQALEGIVDLDDIYFEREFKQLAASVRDWCWKLSRGAGIFVGEEEDRVSGAGVGKSKGKEVAEVERKPCLNREEIEKLMKTHSKIGVITAFVVDKMWKGCWGRYAPGLSDKEEEVLRALEGEMRKSDKIPMASINRWRASTLALLSKSPSTATTIATQTAILASSITHTLSRLLVPPVSATSTTIPNPTISTTTRTAQLTTRPSPSDERSLARILEKAMTLYSQLRAQRARFELIYPDKGEVYDCRTMEDAGDIVVYDEEDLIGGRVGAVAFPGVVKWGEEQEGGRGVVVVVEGKEGSGDAGSAGQGDGSAGAGMGGRPRVLAKVRVLCVVPEEPDE